MSFKKVDAMNPFGPDFSQVSVADEIIALVEDEVLLRDLWLAGYVIKAIESAGGRAMVVGGFVRDFVMNQHEQAIKLKDIDVEVYGLGKDKLQEILERLASDEFVLKGLQIVDLEVNLVGRQFGVYKILGLDIALARRDVRTAPAMGRRPDVQHDLQMDFKDAAFRRDLTINAMGMDIATGQIFDEFSGVEDVENRVIRHIYDKDPTKTQFADDPLRVLRVVQFAARFDYKVAEETFELCRDLDYGMVLDGKSGGFLLASERVAQEWLKLFTYAAKPSVGLELAEQMCVFEKINQDLDEFIKQDKEGWDEVLGVTDACASYAHASSMKEDAVAAYCLAAFQLACNKRGGDFSENFVDLILSAETRAAFWKKWRGFLFEMTYDCGELLSSSSQDEVEYCLRKIAFYKSEIEREYELADEVLSMEDILALILIYNGSKTPLNKRGSPMDIGVGDLSRFRSYKQLITGRDVIAAGIKEGDKVGEILGELLEKQLRGEISTREQALVELKKYI